MNPRAPAGPTRGWTITASYGKTGTRRVTRPRGIWPEGPGWSRLRALTHQRPRQDWPLPQVNSDRNLRQIRIPRSPSRIPLFLEITNTTAWTRARAGRCRAPRRRRRPPGASTWPPTPAGSTRPSPTRRGWRRPAGDTARRRPAGEPVHRARGVPPGVNRSDGAPGRAGRARVPPRAGLDSPGGGATDGGRPTVRLPPQPSAPSRRSSPSAPRPAPRLPEAPEVARPPRGFCWFVGART